jgi:hypothetical protein
VHSPHQFPDQNAAPGPELVWVSVHIRTNFPTSTPPDVNWYEIAQGG